MLQNNFVPQLMATQMPLEVQWFVQDGATPPTADKVLYFLYNNFGTRVVSHRYLDRHYCGNFWPPISANLNPCDLFSGFSEKKKGVPSETFKPHGLESNNYSAVRRDYRRLVS
jgi:hypothetical protein